MVQLNFLNIEQVEKQVHNVSYLKSDKIKKNLKKWNTIKHIYRYQTYYKICEKLFLLTYNNQLACLDYYIEEESDEKRTYTVMYAEIENTADLDFKERLLKHIDLLRQIKKGVDFEYDIKKIDSEVNTLFG